MVTGQNRKQSYFLIKSKICQVSQINPARKISTFTYTKTLVRRGTLTSNGHRFEPTTTTYGPVVWNKNSNKFDYEVSLDFGIWTVLTMIVLFVNPISSFVMRYTITDPAHVTSMH